jgi:ABC-2 type transport system permease protein
MNTSVNYKRTSPASMLRGSTLYKYLSFFSIRFSAGLQYRAAAIAGIITQFVWGVMEIKMFSAFWRTDPNAFPMELDSLFSYVWLQQALLAMFMLWFFDNDIFTQISSGGVALELCRPCDIYTMWFVKNCALRLSKVVLRCFPILIVTAFLPSPYGLIFPKSIGAFALFFISLWLGFIVVVAVAMLVYISSFYTLSPIGVRVMVATVAEFCSGAVVPLPFLPEGVMRVLSFLPFASMQSTPFLIYGGTLIGHDAYFAVALQFFWAVVLIIAGKLFMKTALKNVVLQGG